MFRTTYMIYTEKVSASVQIRSWAIVPGDIIFYKRIERNYKGLSFGFMKFRIFHIQYRIKYRIESSVTELEERTNDSNLKLKGAVETARFISTDYLVEYRIY